MGKIKAVLKKRHYLLLKIIIILIVIVICAVSGISYFKGNILPVVLTMSEATVKALAINAINNATQMIIDEKQINYEELVKITKDVNDKIQLIQTNTVVINRLSRDLARMCQNNIEKIENQTISLPIGAFSGSIVLSGLGPNVEIQLMPIGSVTCDFVSLFEEVGINQTRHSIYININTTIALVLPVSSVPVNTTTAILVCDNIIVGEVPQFYFNGGNAGKDMIDLLPFS